MRMAEMRQVMFLSRCILVLIGCWIQSAQTQSNLQALTYLTQYGYVEGSSNEKGSLITEDSLIRSIKDFQRFAGLNITGLLDDSTMQMMDTPRCGVKDKIGHGSTARRKRYALQGSRWRVAKLTYKISKYPSTNQLTKSDVDDEIKKAFQVWSDVTNLNFEAKTSGRVHIEIRFEKGEHGDGDPFDGAGGTLAHAYFPIYGGDAHFDDAERWSIRSYRGTNLFQVAAHEFGHSLGLSHSDVHSSLMAPFYRGYTDSFQLHDDDKKAIQELYGEKVKEGGTKKPIKPTVSTNDGGQAEGELCSDSTIDAVFTTPDKKTYTLKGEDYWEVADEGLANGYPRIITKDWVGLTTPIDAAFSWTNGKTYFFKGDQYWRYTGKQLDSGYPKPIKQGFAGIPDDVDAAMVWSGNGKIYFFKGSKYWKFDPERSPPVAYDYPKSVSNWEGIPNNIDAAFQWTNGFTYFFKGINYWRFNDRKFAVDVVSPPFPRSSAVWWFGCKAMSSDIAGAMHKGTDVQITLDKDDVDGFFSDSVDGDDTNFHEDEATQSAAMNMDGSGSAMRLGSSSAFSALVIGLSVTSLIYALVTQ